MTISFNLIDEPWVSCLDATGEPAELGLRDFFHRAHELRSLSHPSPMVESAMLRMLLALTHCIVDGPSSTKQWAAVWDAGRFDPARVDEYLDRWAHRFDLFDARWPFFQVGGFTILDGKGNEKPPDPINRLVVERATGNNATLFDHSLDTDPAPLSAAEAARQLVATQSWALGGGKGPTSRPFGAHPYSSHAPCVGSWFTVIRGGCAFQTLAANLLRIGDEQLPGEGHRGLPCWESEELAPPSSPAPRGYLEYLTWTSRAVRLIPDDSGTVSSGYFAPWLGLGAGMGPFAFYREHEKHGLLPVGLRPGRALWRDSEHLLATGKGKTRRPLTLRQMIQRKPAQRLESARVVLDFYGLANDKAKPLSWRRESLTVAANVAEDDATAAAVLRALVGIEDAYRCLTRACYAVAAESLRKPGQSDNDLDKNAVGSLSRRLAERANYWGRVEPRFLELLAEGADDTAVDRCLESVRKDAIDALDETEAAVPGSTPRRVKAMALGRHALRRNLSSTPKNGAVA